MKNTIKPLRDLNLIDSFVLVSALWGYVFSVVYVITLL